MRDGTSENLQIPGLVLAHHPGMTIMLRGLWEPGNKTPSLPKISSSFLLTRYLPLSSNAHLPTFLK
jgi:hypothetical protein